MSSINTNNGAMVALQTLQSVNKNLGEVQGQISTGLKVGSAKDNSAVFAISQVMKSDVSGFKAVSDSLSLGASTLAVASAATDSISDTLNEIKTKIVSANESNVDRGKLDDEINSLVEQVKSVVGAAQFNGLNLIDGGGDLDIMSSLDRSGAGVSTGKITVSATDLSVGTGTAIAGFAGSDGESTSGDSFSASLNGGETTDVTFAAIADGNEYSITVGDTEFSYTAKAGDDAYDASYDLRSQIADSGLEVSASVDSGTGVLTITNDSTDSLMVSGESFSSGGGGGGLSALNDIDVNSASGAAEALTAIETMIGTVIDAAASFGTAEKRVEMQGEFMSKLTDSFTSGIGSLVDADMEAASARLQALQVQQQLGTQALSIANQAPQQLVSLFR